MGRSEGPFATTAAARCGRREEPLCVTKRAYSVACNPTIDRRFSFSVSGDKVEAAVYAANIENCGDCWVTVYLDRQHGAFHGTSPEPRLAVRRGLMGRLIILPIPKRQIHTHETKSLRLG
jgi:hypothetical protein